VLAGDGFDVRHDFVTCCRIKTACWLIEEENTRGGDELRCDADSSFLTTTQTFSEGSSDEGVTLCLQTKLTQEALHAAFQFLL
jgi:hypothetical protein